MRSKLLWLVPAVLLAGLVAAWVARDGHAVPEAFPVLDADPADPEEAGGVATFGSGCFWCTEAVFRDLKGVRKVESGYSGGHVPNPTYAQVCGKKTGHAEVVQVTYDPTAVTFPELLEVFWRTHDPTTKDRQGNDVGPQYRSVVFYHTDRQRRLAERYKQRIDAAGVFARPVVTEVVAFEAFYPAEADHQDYFARNPRQPYCQAVIGPKVEKLRKVFGDRLKLDR